MNKRNRQTGNADQIKTGRIEDGMIRYSLGKNTMRQIAKEAGAEIHIGRSYLLNFSKLDDYFDSITE